MEKFSKRTVIDRGVLHQFVPVIPTIVIYLFLDRLNAVEWVWGVVGLVVLIFWAAIIYETFQTRKHNLLDILNYLDYLNEDEGTAANKRALFSDRLKSVDFQLWLETNKLKED